MTPEEAQAKAEAFNTKLEEAQKAIAEAATKEEIAAVKESIDGLKEEFKGLDKSEEIAELKESLKAQGEALTAMRNKGSETIKSEAQQIREFFSKKENIDKIKAIQKAGSGVIEFEVKAPAAITTANDTVSGTVPALHNTTRADEVAGLNLKRSFIDNLVTVTNYDKPTYSYKDWIPGEGDYAVVSEGGLKPLMDLDSITRFEQPIKIAAHLELTEESIDDVQELENQANVLLRRKHDLKRQNEILFNATQGITTVGSPFVPGAMANSVQDANFIDAMNACITQVYTSSNYNDEEEYMANVCLVSPLDYFTEVQARKNADNMYLFSGFALFQTANYGQVQIIPRNEIPQGKILVADLSKYQVKNYKPFTVRIGWINDQFITNEFTMVGESRFYRFVKELDKLAFVYDDIATIKATLDPGVTDPV